MSCCDCTAFACMKGGDFPEDCTAHLCADDARDQVLDLYLNDDDMRSVMVAATLTARVGSRDKWPRLREVIDFAHRTGVQRIGIASCSTYIREVPVLAQILRDEGFEVMGAMCKMATIRRSDVGIPEDPIKHDSIICNPLMQAEALNNAGTDMNIAVGLCVGHDMLFAKHSEALCTTLVVRDQSLGGRLPFAEALERFTAEQEREHVEP